MPERSHALSVATIRKLELSGPLSRVDESIQNNRYGRTHGQMVVISSSGDWRQNPIGSLKHFIRQSPRRSEEEQTIVPRFKPLAHLGMRNLAFGFPGRCGSGQQEFIRVQPHQFRPHIHQTVTDGDQPEGFLPVRIGNAAVAAHPVIHDMPYQGLLIGERRNDIDACNVEGSARSCQVVNVEIRDGRGDGHPFTVLDRMMDQRQKNPPDG